MILPQGNTPGERIARWIEENVTEETTANVLRRSIHREVPTKDTYSFFLVVDDGKATNVSWIYEGPEDEYAEGRGVHTMPPNVLAVFCEKLRIASEWRK